MQWTQKPRRIAWIVNHRTLMPAKARIMNASFEMVVATFSAYAMALSEAVKKFSGLVVVRVFGREHPARYCGAPALYRAGLPGRRRDTGEMREKAQRLLGGDRELAWAIRSTQNRVLDSFSVELASRRWEQLFNRHFSIRTAAA
jgi:hypothetical protein